MHARTEPIRLTKIETVEVYLWAADSVDGQNVMFFTSRTAKEPKFITSSIAAHRASIRCVEDRKEE
ncbi:hypothetical protein [Fibrobacter sp.]|uniref:hypothetical protein n=1 Tax=Fibrobacter sp. TaxID=35828 RepID=UPI0038906BE1